MKNFVIISICMCVVSGCATLEEHKEMTLTPIFLQAKNGHFHAAPTMSPVAKFGDNYWVVSRSFKYQISSTNNFIVVPKGFITDLASIPRFIWSFGLSPIDTYMTPAVIHDYLYWDQRCTKEEADAVLGLSMIESEVSPAKQLSVYRGVDWFGRSSYRKNAALKDKGETRFVTPQFVEELFELPMPASTDLKKVLQLAQHKKSLIFSDNHNPTVKDFCAAALNKYRK